MRGTNFADPTYEPSDDELVALSVEAFAELQQHRERDRVQRRAEASALQGDALARLPQLRTLATRWLYGYRR